MLEELRIRGLGVIDDAVLPLGPGLTVVTGETGAGKTMVVTGLLLLFGGRADTGRVRSGAGQASVDGRVRLDPSGNAARRALDAGATFDGGDELILRRSVTAAGRSRAHVGGASAPVAVLADLADDLIAVHGQSDQLRLARPAAQRSVLDRFAGIETSDVAEAYGSWRAASAALADRTSRAAQLRREADLLAYGLAEIDAVGPQPGEIEELTRTSSRLGRADALTLAARTAHDALVGSVDDPAGDGADVLALMAGAARAVGQHDGVDADLDALAGRLTELSALAVDLAADLGGYTDQVDTDPARLEQVESRRAALGSLVRKYCDEPEPSVGAVLRWADAARARLADIDVSDGAIAALTEKRDAAAARLAQLAGAVSTRRHAAADDLGAAVTAELVGLAMPDARLTIGVSARPPGSSAALTVSGEQVGVTADGYDEVELLLRPHPGAPALPIARGASGGELSRVMLALEVCLLGATVADEPVTLVFDEVDAGVGGRAAVEVGRRLARLAKGHQVLVVTHLPQVAAFADRHIVVDKPAGGRDASVTASDVRLVTGGDRVGELARMLSGSDTPTAREHAAELLAESTLDPPQRRTATRGRRSTERG